jgi:hypothetical protein
MVAVSWVHRIFVLSFERIVLVARPYAVSIIPIAQGILRHARGGAIRDASGKEKHDGFRK